MLKKTGIVIASITLAIGLNGCMKTNIEKVKNSVSNDYKSTTIGKAFDNWDNCKKESSGWSEFETDNGKKIVEFKCDVKREKFLKKAIELVNSEDDEFSKGFAKFLDLKQFTKTFQWAINTDDSIELNYTGLIMEWADGKIFEDNVNQEKSIKAVYINEISFNNEVLNNKEKGSTLAGYMANSFLQIYNSSKTK